jgi:hypothetical protein
MAFLVNWKEAKMKKLKNRRKLKKLKKLKGELKRLKLCRSLLLKVGQFVEFAIKSFSEMKRFTSSILITEVFVAMNQ